MNFLFGAVCTQQQKQKYREENRIRKSAREEDGGGRDETWRFVKVIWKSFIWGILCCIFFFFLFLIFFTLLHIKKHQKMKNIIKDWMKTVHFSAVCRRTSLEAHFKERDNDPKLALDRWEDGWYFSLPC